MPLLATERADVLACRSGHCQTQKAVIGWPGQLPGSSLAFGYNAKSNKELCAHLANWYLQLTTATDHLSFYLLSFDSRPRTAADRLMNTDTDHVRKFKLA